MVNKPLKLLPNEQDPCRNPTTLAVFQLEAKNKKLYQSKLQRECEGGKKFIPQLPPRERERERERESTSIGIIRVNMGWNFHKENHLSECSTSKGTSDRPAS